MPRCSRPPTGCSTGPTRCSPRTRPTSTAPTCRRRCSTGSGSTPPGWTAWPTSCGCSRRCRTRSGPGWCASCPARWSRSGASRSAWSGANFEARPNVVVDIASQLLKSRNAGVLRTGSAALGSAAALLDEVIAPALGAAGLDPAAIQLVRLPGRDTARALVGPARAGPAGHPARQRRTAPASSPREAAPARGPHARPRRRRRRALPRPRRRRRQGARAGRARAWTGSASATGSTCCWSTRSAGTSCCPASRAVLDRLGDRRLAAAARPPARAGVGAARRARGDGDDRPGRRPGRGGPSSPTRRRPGWPPASSTEDAGGRGRVPRHVRRDRRVLERHHPAAGRVQAARRAGDRDQHRPACPARAARSRSSTCICASTSSRSADARYPRERLGPRSPNGRGRPLKRVSVWVRLPPGAPFADRPQPR